MKNCYAYLLFYVLVAYSLIANLQPTYQILDPAVKDSKVEDIQIPAPNVPARIIHSDYDKLISNIVLDENELNNYVEKLVYKSGKNISAFRPLLSIRSSDTTRLTVTYKKGNRS